MANITGANSFLQVYFIGREIRYPIVNLLSDMENLPENVIHVTGFGVFRGFTKKNPSWEAVSLLPNHIVHNGKTIPIVKHEVPVTYTDVDKKIQEIWSAKPKLVVHCGVHGKTDKICLERNAFNGNFREADYRGECLESCNATLPNSGSECKRLCTSLNVENIIKDIDAAATIAKCSDHPGDYLCGYIYLQSLDKDATRSLFIHVPPPRDDLPITKMSDVILSVIKHCVKQLDDNVANN